MSMFLQPRILEKIHFSLEDCASAPLNLTLTVASFDLIFSMFVLPSCPSLHFLLLPVSSSLCLLVIKCNYGNTQAVACDGKGGLWRAVECTRDVGLLPTDLDHITVPQA